MYHVPLSTPAASWVDAGAHGHSVQFYAHDQFLLDAVSRFVGSALEAGNVAIAIATPAHRDGLAERLRAQGRDMTRAVGDRRYIAMDAAETLAQFMHGGWPDPGRFTNTVGRLLVQGATTARRNRAGVVAFGEMVALLYADGQPQAALRLEQLWNGLARTHGFSLLCAYPMRLFRHAEDDRFLRGICAEHRDVIPDESYTSLPSEAERMQTITLLQHKAQVLEAEIAAHGQWRAGEAALRVREALLASVSHDLKTPLTNIRLLAEMLQQQAAGIGAPQDTERIAAWGAKIEVLGARMTAMLDELAHVARLHTGEPLRRKRAPTDLVALARRMAAEHQDTTRRHLLRVETDEGEMVGTWDEPSLHRVLDNLLSNAVKYSPAGGPITLQVAREGNWAVLRVTDAGRGIPARDVPRVFEPYYRGHEAAGLAEGTGLGLASVRQIVEQHGGAVAVESTPGKGSTVTVRLPMSESMKECGRAE